MLFRSTSHTEVLTAVVTFSLYLSANSFMMYMYMYMYIHIQFTGSPLYSVQTYWQTTCTTCLGNSYGFIAYDHKQQTAHTCRLHSNTRHLIDLCNTYMYVCSAAATYKCTYARCTSEPPLGMKHVCGGLRAVGQQPDKAHLATQGINTYHNILV